MLNNVEENLWGEGTSNLVHQVHENWSENVSQLSTKLSGGEFNCVSLPSVISRQKTLMYQPTCTKRRLLLSPGATCLFLATLDTSKPCNHRSEEKFRSDFVANDMQCKNARQNVHYVGRFNDTKNLAKNINKILPICELHLFSALDNKCKSYHLSFFVSFFMYLKIVLKVKFK